MTMLLGIPASTLRYWRHLSPPQGPKCYRLGRRKVVYDPADVVAWRESRKAETVWGGM
ncbi:helix-turn-helix transcriptional regulator [Mycolicibacterium sp.]|uniref:helix-turn-helix transcriptional regulator n=1 Tax=Mycolicibacterium sp. TaxID=2320850 RepID=UPI003D102FC0